MRTGFVAPVVTAQLGGNRFAIVTGQYFQPHNFLEASTVCLHPVPKKQREREERTKERNGEREKEKKREREKKREKEREDTNRI